MKELKERNSYKVWAGCLLFLFLIAFTGSGAEAAGKTVNMRIIYVGSAEEAEKVVSEIKGGRPFAFLAGERSLDEKSRRNYGYMEGVRIKTLEAPIREAVSALGEGQMSGIIKVSGGRYAVVEIVVLRYYMEGKAAFIAGDFGKAEENLLKHIELNPDAVKACILLGQIYEDRKETDKAEKFYKEAVSFDPKSEEAYSRLGIMYLKQEKYQEAINTYEEGQRNIPGSRQLKSGLKTVMNNIIAKVKDEMPSKAKKKASGHKKNKTTKRNSGGRKR